MFHQYSDKKRKKSLMSSTDILGGDFDVKAYNIIIYLFQRIIKKWKVQPL